MARGMNMGILALLAVTGMVLGGAVTFCVYLANQAKKSAPHGLHDSRTAPWDLEPGRAAVLRDPDAPQRVPTRFMGRSMNEPSEQNNGEEP